MATVMFAPGVTVTLDPPESVAELMVRFPASVNAAVAVSPLVNPVAVTESAAPANCGSTYQVDWALPLTLPSASGYHHIPEAS